MNWKKILGTGIDVAMGVSGVNAISYGATGKTIGSHLTGGSYASDLGDNILGRNPEAKDNLMGYQMETATTQGAEAARLKAELEAQGRPDMQAAVARQQQVVGLAEQFAREGMPEAQRQFAQDNIAANQAGQLSAMSSMGSGLRGLGTTQASTAQAYRQLNAQDSAIAQQNQGQYLQQLGVLGGLEGQAEGYNVLQPYAEKVAEMQALLGSSQQNQFNALSLDYQNQMASQQMAMDLIGSGMQAAGPALAGFSDIRLKENINHTGFSESGIPTYTWNYTFDSDKKLHSGTMAQDLLEMGKKEAVIRTISGFYAVDYSKIDVDFK